MCPYCHHATSDHHYVAASITGPEESGCTECGCRMSPRDIRAWYRDHRDVNTRTAEDRRDGE